jgi:plastocyanin
MLRRGKAAGRIWLLTGIVVAGVLFAGGLAFAASATIVGTGGDVYTPTDYNADQGEISQLQVTGSSHNVTARQNGPDGKVLFRSATISGGFTPVSGTQYLATGDYPFFCTVHPTTMSGTLHVSTSGAPQPRPSAALSIRAKKIAKVLKKGINVALNTSAKVDDVSLVAKLGKATIGRSSDLSLAQGQVFETIKLSKSGKSKLRSKRKATVTVTADIPFGSPATAKAKLK